MSEACSTHGSDDKQIQNFGQINKKERCLEDLSVVWKVVLKQVFKKTDGNIWTLNVSGVQNGTMADAC